MKIFQEHTKINISVFLVIVTGIVLLIGKIYFYTIHGDDPWFAEEAYWLVQTGKVRSEFFSSMLDYGVQQFAYHKLHIWIAALAIKLFGFSYLVLKSITLGFFAVFLLVSRRYFYRFHSGDAKESYFIFLAFILINSLILELAFVYRPEMAIMCFGFMAYFFIRKSCAEKGAGNIALAGLFAGLCALMHLNGLIFIVAGFTLYLANRRYQYAFLFGAIAACVASIYFIDILPDHWAAYWMQFRHDPAIPRGQFNFGTLVGRILFEYDRFFGHGYESGYSLLLLTVLVIDRKYIWNQIELRNSLIYFISLTFTLAAISPGKNHYYLLFGMPYAGILVSASILKMIKNRDINKIKNSTLRVISLLYVLANIPHAIAIINDGRGGHHVVQNNMEVMKHFDIHKGDKVLAPLGFIFNSIEKVDIQGVDAFIARADRGYVPLTAEAFFKEAKKNNRKFILIFGDQMAMLKITPEPARAYNGYRYVGNMDGYYVFKAAVHTG